MSKIQDKVLFPCVLGIDPGKKGAIALVDYKGKLAFSESVQLFPNKKRIHDRWLVCFVQEMVAKYNPICAYIEQVGAMPGQGVTSMFGFGYSTGLLHGVVAANGLPVYQVPPKTWKSHYGLIGSAKTKSIDAANLIWPDAIFRSIDQAEAALIAAYGMTVSMKNSGR